MQGDAIIVGGGVGGLAAGVALARLGWSVDVAERGAALRRGGGALMLWYNGVRALDALGIGEDIRARSIEVERADLRGADGEVFQSLAVGARARARGRTHRVIERAALLDALAAALPNGALRFGARCAGVDPDAQRPRCDFEGEPPRRADLVLGADGLHSVARSALHGASAPRSAAQDAWVGSVDAEVAQALGLSRGATVGLVGRGLRFWYAATLTGGYWYAIVSHTAAKRARIVDRDSLAQAFSRWQRPVAALIEATTPEALTRVEICDRVALPRWSVGAVTLLGDAAHPMTPDLGQGACQALEDAVALGDALRDADNVVDGLARYERVRARRAAAIAELSWFSARLSMPDDEARCAIRDFGWRRLPEEAFAAELDQVIDDGFVG